MRTILIVSLFCELPSALCLCQTNGNRLCTQVTASLTCSQKLYVHDGAIGSSPRYDAKVRTISDNPSSALLFRSILEPAPTRQVSQEEFPFTVYIASNYR